MSQKTNPLDNKMLSFGKQEQPAAPVEKPKSPTNTKVKKLLILESGVVEQIKRAVYWDRGKNESAVVNEILKNHFAGKSYEPIPNE